MQNTPAEMQQLVTWWLRHSSRASRACDCLLLYFSTFDHVSLLSLHFSHQESLIALEFTHTKAIHWFSAWMPQALSSKPSRCILFLQPFNFSGWETVLTFQGTTDAVLHVRKTCSLCDGAFAVALGWLLWWKAPSHVSGTSWQWRLTSCYRPFLSLSTWKSSPQITTPPPPDKAPTCSSLETVPF